MFLFLIFTPISLYDNKIGAEGAGGLAEALKYNNILMTLKSVWHWFDFIHFSLTDNNIGIEGAVSIAEALKHNNTLTKLL